MATTTIRVGGRIPDTVFHIGLRDQADSSLILFDTPQEVIATLDPGYLSEGAEDEYRAVAARYRIAVAFIDAAHDRLDPEEIAALSDEERMALSVRGRAAVTDVTKWPGRVPLYVMATLHAPYTGAPLPEGDRVYSIDPYTEASLVASLADAGLLDARKVRPGQVWDGGAQ